MTNEEEQEKTPDNETVTINVRRHVRNALEKLKKHPRATFEEVIVDLLSVEKGGADGDPEKISNQERSGGANRAPNEQP